MVAIEQHGKITKDYTGWHFKMRPLAVRSVDGVAELTRFLDKKMFRRFAGTKKIDW